MSKHTADWRHLGREVDSRSGDERLSLASACRRSAGGDGETPLRERAERAQGAECQRIRSKTGRRPQGARSARRDERLSLSARARAQPKSKWVKLRSSMS